MKITHTADWHLDSTTLDQTRQALGMLVQQMLDASPDLCLIAGDLFVKRGYLQPQSIFLVKNAVLSLAEQMPVVIIPGNHDLAHAYDSVDSVTALFTREGTSIHPNLSVLARPCIVEPIDGVQIAGIPSPSKYILLAKEETASAANIEQLISAKLVDVLQGLFAQMDPDKLRILLYHGTITGGIADNERIMDTEKEISLPRHALLDQFDIVACGHLHRPQIVGNAVYSGAIAPLRFDAVGVEPSWVLWDSSTPGVSTRVRIPVAHQLLSIEVTQEDVMPEVLDVDCDPTVVVLGKLAEAPIKDAKVRLRYRLPKSMIELIDTKDVEKALEKAYWYKIDCDYQEDAAIRVEGLKRGMELSDMFDLYATVDKEADPYLPDLKELGEEVDRQMSPEQRLLLKGVHYRPLRLYGENWKPLGKFDLVYDDLGRLVCIDGDNTLGKSNLVEIEPFVLWGPKKGLLRGEPLRKCIRDGCQDCRVGMEIAVDGKDYQVERTVGLTKSSARSTLSVSEKVNGEYKPVNLTQKELEELVGSRELFLATRFARQGDIDRLIEMRPAELKDTLQDAFNVGVFEIRKEISNETLKATSREIEKEEAKQERFESDAAMLSQLEEEREKAESERAPFESVIKDREKKLEEFKADLASLEAKAKRVKDLRDRVLSMRKEEENCHNKWEYLHGEQVKLEETLEMRDEIVARVSEIRVLRERKDEEWEKIQKAREIKDEITGLRQTLKDLQQARQRKLENLKTKQISLKGTIRNLERHSSVLNDVKAFGCEKPGCPAIALAVQNRKEAEERRQELVDLGKEREVLEKQEVGLDIKAAIADLEAKETAIGADEDTWKKIHQQLDSLVKRGWEEKAKEIAVAETKLKEFELQMADLNQRLEKLGSEIIQLELERVKAAEEISQEGIDDLNEQIRQETQLLAANRGKLSGLENRIGQLDADIRRSKEAAEKLEKIKTNLSEKRKRRSILGIFVRAMGRDGIPFLFLEAQLPRWAQYANEFLSVEGATEDWSLSVKVDPIRELATGSPKNEVTVWFTDEKGTHPLQSASGFQRNALGSALRAALAKLMAELTGSSVDVFVHDEAWAAFRENRTFLAQQMVRKYAETFGKVVFVTHQPFMRVIADSVIALEGDVVNGTQVRIEK